MSIANSPLLDVAGVASATTVCQQNFELLAEAVYNATPTSQSGTPTTVIGPPTTGTFALNQIWTDANFATFRCTVAGTPGTWRQITTAVLASLPVAGTIPVGYLVTSQAEGYRIYSHAGSYVWTPVYVGSTMLDGENITFGTSTGSQIGTAVTQKFGFWGATAVVQPASANQASVTLSGANPAAYDALTFSATVTQAEAEAFRDLVADTAQDIANIHTLLEALRAAGVTSGLIKGSA